MANLLGNAFNDSTLSDLEFVVQIGGDDLSKNVIYAHKLVLAMQNPVFMTMFTSGMAESVGRSSKLGQGTKSGNPTAIASDNRTTVPMPEWVEYDPLYCFLRYLYIGKIGDEEHNKSGAKFYPHSEKSVRIAMGMLRLADMYMVDYVKEWYV